MHDLPSIFSILSQNHFVHDVMVMARFIMFGGFVVVLLAISAEALQMIARLMLAIAFVWSFSNAVVLMFATLQGVLDNFSGIYRFQPTL